MPSNLLPAHRQRFDAYVAYARSSPLSRIARSPLHFPFSKILGAVAARLNTPVRTTARTFWDERLTTVYPEQVSMHIHRYGFFEEGLTRMFLDYLKPGMTFIDIGAHMGYFTLLGAALVGDTGQVHSFEPTRSTFDVLRGNTQHRPNVHPQNLAVYSSDTNVRFNDFGLAFAAFNSLRGGRLDEATLAKLPCNKYDVQAVTLDHYVQQHGLRPDLIKIDAEGVEPEILRGAADTLRTVRPMLTLEVGDLKTADIADSSDVVRNLVDEFGYKILEYRDGQIVPHEPRAAYEYDNLLFVPDGRPAAAPAAATSPA